MNNTNSIYDWIIVGGGISGISISEILCREGKSVLLLEKNSKLASETSKDFHEWVHSGALYTLVPDNLLTLRYLLGATDDIAEYYSSFSRMLCRSQFYLDSLPNHIWKLYKLPLFQHLYLLWNHFVPILQRKIEKRKQ